MPRWYAQLLVVVIALVVGFGGVGIVLALAGWFAPLPAVLLGGGVAAGLVRLGWDLNGPPRPDRRSPWSSAMVVLVVTWVLVNVPQAGEHVVVDRDPGVYLVAGRWLAEHGTLAVDAGVGPFADEPQVSYESAGTYDEGGGSLDLQFAHLVPVLLAGGQWIGGERLLVAMPVLLGGAALLMTYGLASRLARRQWAGFLVTASASICLPMLGAVRDTYSEGTTWLLLTGGLWAWTRAADEQRGPLAVFAGLVLGAVAMARADAVVYLLAVPVLAGLLLARRGADPAPWRGPLLLVAGIVPGVALGAADLLLRSREYYRDLRGEILGLWVAFAVAVVVGGGLWAWTSARGGRRPGSFAGWLEQHRRGLSVAAAAGVAVVGIAAWTIRPQVQVARSSAPFEYIGAIQAAEGQPVEPDRRYDERSVEWLAWYVGAPAVVLGIAGAALVAARATSRPPGPTGVAWLALGSGTALYLWRPSITPDHLWAARRFVPAALPLVLILAATSIVAAVDGLQRRWGLLSARVAGLGLALAVFVPTATRMLPVARLSDQHGFLDLIDGLCDAVEGGAVLTVQDERAGITLPQTLRSFCGVPAGVVAADVDPAVVARLADEWAAQDRRLLVVATSPEVIEALVPGGAQSELGPYNSDRTLEVTVTRPPGRLAAVSEVLFVTTVPSAPPR